MIDVSNRAIFDSARVELSMFKRSAPALKGRFTQIFLGMKYHQNVLPSMFSGQFVTTELLQQLLDDLYSKASRPANQCVLMIFENNFIARTGLIGPGRGTAQNTWRNNFNLQKGIGCFAPPLDLASRTFLDQSRAYCRYLRPAPPTPAIPSATAVAGTPPQPPSTTAPLSGATCSLCTTNAEYRGEDHRKWLRIDPGQQGYAVVDLMNVSNFRPYVAPGGVRIPILPLIVALYHDSIAGLSISGQAQVDTPGFAADFNFATSELQAYFDDSSTNPHNAALLAAFPGLAYTSFALLPPPAAPVALASATPTPARRVSGPVVLSSTPVPPPLVNTGWDAEQYVSNALSSAGWTVYDVSRQRAGYDLYATKGSQTRYIDVKSSLGYCAPSLTAREWEKAKIHGPRYVLAIIENFAPNASNGIFWVTNPAGFRARQTTTVNYSISRSDWTLGVVPLSAI
jgi:hypothetical protein